jgi:hypothetical protein
MRQGRLTAAGAGALVLFGSGGALAQALDAAATDAPPQHYLMALPPAPVGEVAQEVLGDALGLPFEVDEDVTAEMGFRVDGVYAPEELAREFGYRLWNVDVVLLDAGDRGLKLIPRHELADALAAGARVVSPLASTEPARATGAQADLRPAIAYGRARWDRQPWALPLVLLLGWLAGLGTAFAAWRLRRRPPAALPVRDPLRLSAPSMVVPVLEPLPEPGDQKTWPTSG